MVTHTQNLCSAFNPSKCTHTVVNTHTHTHTVNTHLEQWALGSQCCSAQGAEPRGVRCLAQGSVPHILFSCGIEGGESAGYSLPPPTIPAGPETRTCVPQVTSPTLYPLSHDYPPIWCDFKFSFVFGVLQAVRAYVRSVKLQKLKSQTQRGILCKSSDSSTPS